jgi:O-methyltransferase involved in polyketide biosynthesis
MQDAERSAPVCNDTYAKVFMNVDGLKILEAFKDDIRPNESNVARHRIIDELLHPPKGVRDFGTLEHYKHRTLH